VDQLQRRWVDPPNFHVQLSSPQFKTLVVSGLLELGSLSTCFFATSSPLLPCAIWLCFSIRSLPRLHWSRHFYLSYNQDKIYTHVGDILIAINPYRPLNVDGSLYQRLYDGTLNRGHAPHIYGVADAATYYMRSSQKNQCCIVSGKSPNFAFFVPLLQFFCVK
jgi:hypothetical protein